MAQETGTFKGRVAVAGLGGLGSHIAVFLARSGVRHLHLIDFDRVDESNLHRQYYRIQDIGNYKTETLRKEIQAITSECTVAIDTVRVTEENIDGLFKHDEIICEAFDNPVAKALLVNAILGRFPEKILVSASGLAGYGSANDIVTRKITNRFYLCGDGINEVKPGERLVAPRVALCAGHQALMVIRLLRGEQTV